MQGPLLMGVRHRPGALISFYLGQLDQDNKCFRLVRFVLASWVFGDTEGQLVNGVIWKLSQLRIETPISRPPTDTALSVPENSGHFS